MVSYAGEEFRKYAAACSDMHDDEDGRRTWGWESRNDAKERSKPTRRSRDYYNAVDHASYP